jgi:hypothetical protein
MGSIILENFVGCVGLFKKVLNKAVMYSLSENESKVTERDLMRSLNAKLLVEQALKEVEIGHEIMRNI